MTSRYPQGQAHKFTTRIYLRLNISTTVRTAAMGQMPRSTERILVIITAFVVAAAIGRASPLGVTHAQINGAINDKLLHSRRLR